MKRLLFTSRTHSQSLILRLSFVGVKATTSFYAKEVIDKVPPEKRQCLAKGEKNLKYFNHYSRSACFIECDARVMLERCQCRPYFFKGKNEYEF